MKHIKKMYFDVPHVFELSNFRSKKEALVGGRWFWMDADSYDYGRAQRRYWCRYLLRKGIPFVYATARHEEKQAIGKWWAIVCVILKKSGVRSQKRNRKTGTEY